MTIGPDFAIGAKYQICVVWARGPTGYDGTRQQPPPLSLITEDRMACLGYTCIGTNDFDRALGFYDPFFAAMGGKRLMPTPNGILYALETGAAIMVVRPYDGERASPGNGTMLAFRVAERREVAALHALALSLGGSCAGAPGPRAEWGEFAYLRDLDGNKLAIFHRPQKAA